MSEEMNLILEKLSGIDKINETLSYMQTDIYNMKGDITSMKGDITNMKGDITNMKSDITNMKSDITNMKSDIINLKADISNIHTEVSNIKADISTLQTKLTSVQFTLENETNKKIDVIGEGHDFLKRSLSEALTLEKDKERMDLEILNIKMNVRKLMEEHEIA